MPARPKSTCVKECGERTETCRIECTRLKEYEAEKREYYRIKKIEWQSEYVSYTKRRAMRKSLNKRKEGRR